jgi:OOP family OmpA-OmpF porin
VPPYAGFKASAITGIAAVTGSNLAAVVKLCEVMFSAVHGKRAPRVLLFVLSAGAAVGVSEPLFAQSVVDGEFTVQRFDPAPGPRNYFTTRGARTDGEMAFSAGLFGNYAWQPFVVSSCPPGPDCSDPQEVLVVENLVAADVLASLTPIPRLQLGLKVPVAWAKGQGIDDEGGPADDGIDAVGLGDIELEGKVRLYGEVKDPFVVGASVFGTAPTGEATAEGSYIGDSTPTVGVRGIFDGDAGPFSFGGNLAGVWRGDGRVGETDLGSEFRYGVAAGVRIGPVLRVVVDSIGSTRFTTGAGENALEGLLGLQVTPLGTPLTLSAGAGTGIVDGVGVPNVRAFVGFNLSFERRDRDGDGIGDSEDRCPTDAEDIDTYEDSDGCPDQDNDLDSIADADDRCPMKAEDADGFDDTDGCPEFDNDNDGINDDQDRCPDKPETKNGVDDEDGCPDVKDSDADGVLDGDDQCVAEPEDTDGFQDEDGCPDDDNDGDGVDDKHDECQEEAETVNGFEDTDGCPDTAPAKKR